MDSHMQGHHGDIIQVIIMQLTRLHAVCNKWVHSSNESLGLQKNNSLRSQLHVTKNSKPAFNCTWKED